MDLERAERRHDTLQRWMLAGVSLGVLASATRDILDLAEVAAAWSAGLSIAALAGWLLFAVTIMALTGTSKELLTSVIDDERVRDNRGRAYAFGLSAVLVFLIVAMLAVPTLRKTTGLELPGDLVATVGVGVAVVASLGRFLALNR